MKNDTIGIYCLVGGSSNNNVQQLKRLVGYGSCNVPIWLNANENVVSAVISTPFRYKASSYRDSRGNWLMVDGLALDPETYLELNAVKLLHLVGREGVKALHCLNGEFMIVVCIGSEVWLISDRLSQRQHCLAQAGDRIAFAPTPGKAIDLLCVPREVHDDALVTFLFSNKLRLNDQTIWRGCRVMPEASQYYINPLGELRHTQYWSMRYKPDSSISREDMVNETAEIFRRAVSARMSAEASVVITLSGGLDSRLLAGSVPVEKRNNVMCSTMGIPFCDDIKLARQVAGISGYSYNEVSIKPETPFAQSCLPYLENEDIDLLSQNCWQSFLEANSACDFLLHGIGLDVAIGGIYLTQELSGILSHTLLVDYAMRNALSDSHDLLSRLFSDNIMDNATESIRSRIAAMLETSHEDDILSTYDHFIIKYGMCRVLFQRCRAIRSIADTLSPLYDIHLIDLYLRIPAKVRMQRGLFQSMLMNICPELAEVPYQRTSLPPSVPIRHWSEGQRLENERENLYRRIAYETKGKSYLPYLRHEINVDEWLRFDPIWMRATQELLQSSRSSIRERYVNPSQLDKIITEHQNHKRSHMKIIHLLMSAEIFLRRTQSEDISDLFQKLIYESCKK